MSSLSGLSSHNYSTLDGLAIGNFDVLTVNNEEVATEESVHASFVPKLGTTMLGPLILYGPPTLPLEACSKSYADSVTTHSFTPNVVIISTPSGTNFTSSTTTTTQLASLDTSTSITNQFSALTSGVTLLGTSSASLSTYSSGRASALDSLSTTVGNHTTSISLLGTSSAALSSYATGRASALDSLSTTVGNHTSSISLLGTSSASLSSYATGRASALDSLSTTVGSHTSSISLLGTSSASLSTYCSNLTVSNNTAVASINTNLALKAPIAAPTFTGIVTMATNQWHRSSDSKDRYHFVANSTSYFTNGNTANTNVSGFVFQGGAGSAATILEISNSGNIQGKRMTINAGSGLGAAGIRVDTGASAGDQAIAIGGRGIFAADNNGTVAGRFIITDTYDGSGYAKVGINNATPSYHLDVNGTSKFSDTCAFYGSNFYQTGIWNYSLDVVKREYYVYNAETTYQTGASSNALAYRWLSGAGGIIMDLMNDSRLFIAAGQLTASDYRIKKDIVDATGALDHCMALEVRQYKYQDTRRHDMEVYGLIAQQVQSVLPEWCSIITNTIPNVFADAEWMLDEKTNEVTLTVDTTNITNGRIRLDLVTDRDNVVICECAVVDGTHITVPKWEKYELTTSVLVYGMEVDDFHTIDKAAISVCTLGGLQELNRKYEAEKIEMQSEIDTLKSQVAALMTYCGL
jgi:hypothetical protein